MKTELTAFNVLNALDVNKYAETKKTGTTELKYLSWPYAWAEVKKRYPDATYNVQKFNGLPYVYDPVTGYMVYTTVTIEGVTHEMWLPVMDGANKAMRSEPYTYKVAKWEYNQQTRRREKVGMEEKVVEPASMFEINKTIMRCLVKNLAMFGLGLYIFAGEDLPEDMAQPNAVQSIPQAKATARKATPCICSNCRRPITPVQMRDGTTMTAVEFAEAYGGVCADCYRELNQGAA